MKAVGILGLLTIIGIAFLLSNNKKSIKIRVVIWGIFLQFLFAVIVLSKNFVSWIGIFVFSLLVLIYLFDDRILRKQNIKSAVLSILSISLFSLIVLICSFFLDRWHIAVYLFWSLFLLYFISLLLKQKAFIRNLFALTMQVGLGMLVQRNILGRDIFAVIADKVNNFLKLSDLGSEFLFGNLANPEYFDHFGFQFAFTVLPIIIFFSAIIGILYHIGVMQTMVKMMARFMKWTMGTSGAETLSCSSNVFVGQTEAPLLIRPFLKDLTNSELNAVMVGGFATIAGSVMGGYMRMGINPSHLIAASVMAAPASLAMAKIFYPETTVSKTAADVEMPDVERADNLLDATARGVGDGLRLAANVGAMLIAFIALIGLVNVILGFFDQMIDGRLLGGVVNETNGECRGIFPGSLETLFGTIFAPLAFLMGVPWKDAAQVGNLIGIKISLNEFVAYAELAKHVKAASLTERSIIIATYALCGFANFASIGIQIGGISALVPNRRADISRVALRAMLAGALVSCMSATMAGLLL